MFRTLISLAAATVLAGAAHAQDETPPAAESSPIAQVMVLGSPHLSAEAEETMAPQRQAEIVEVVERLSRFEPTRIVVELMPEHEEAFNAAYQAYLAGERELAANEREQIGMRLAAELGHERLYAADFSVDRFEVYMDFPGMIEAAEEAGQAHLIENNSQIGARYEDVLEGREDQSFRERLIVLNGKEYDALHSSYLTLAQMGDRGTPYAAEQMSEWWRRNIHIFAQAAQIAEPGDRILIVYGVGHKHLLDYFFGHADEFTLVDPLDYIQD